LERCHSKAFRTFILSPALTITILSEMMAPRGVSFFSQAV
jgi:hypothetical protein